MASRFQFKGQNDKTIEILEEQIKVCEKIKYLFGLAHSYEIIGVAYQGIGNFDKSVECFLESNKNYEAVGNLSFAARTLARISIIYSVNQKFEIALENMYKALDIAKKISNRFLISTCIGNIGSINFEMGNFDEALKNIKIHLKMSEEVNNKAGMGESLLVIGNIYTEIGEFDKALEYVQKSKEILEPLEIREKILNIYLIEAQIRKLQKLFSEAEVSSDKVIEIAKEFKLQFYLEKGFFTKAEFCFLQNKLEKAKSLIKEFEELQNKNPDVDSQFNQLKKLICFEEGLHDKVISYFQAKFKSEKDEISQAETHFYLTNLGVRSYDLGTKILSLEEINSHKENAIRLYEKLYYSSPRFLYKSRIEELKSIVFHPQSISPQLLKSLVKWMNPETVFSELLKFLSEECQADGCQIILKNSNSEEFEVCAISPNLKEDEIDFSSGILQEAIEAKKPILIEDATHSEKFQSNKSILGKIFLSVIAVPLEINKEICGALYLHRTKVKRGYFLKDDLEKVIEISELLSPILFRQRESVKLKMDSEIRNFGIIGNSPKMHSLFEKIKLTVNVNYPIYIYGETGTGKELVAKALHEFSKRKSENFVVVNCSTIPKDLAESELFGFEKGSFSGASAMQKGKFELSDGGALFLDEIGELTLPIQSKILRVIQEKEIWRVGGQKAIKLDLRIIVATHRNLEEEVQKGNFREDLYHRLNVVKLVIPPLRERAEDILVLANHFLKKQSKELGKKVDTFTSEAIAIVQMQDWKGNVRELENTIAKALILKTNESPINSNELGLTSIPFLTKNSNSIQTSNFEGDTFDDKISILERKILVDELEKNDWNKSKTATSLRLTRDKLYRLLNKHQLLS